MYVRIVRGNPMPGKVDEAARLWEELLAPQFRSIPGFRAAYFYGDRAANVSGGISLWDAKPGDAVNQAMQEFRQRINDVSLGPPTIEDFEVLAEA